ncbi:MAG: hypothetical protein BGN87_07095 [Rhizobiales bacterium 65-79]|jgi:type VI secretion system VasI family protein|nr:hypothetical protein [Hyphomicrobiales bacterium]OJU02108.1 MAG: hypothetical protein BGN87_07095 [Rhizobiales bacterium 65-79]
MKIIALTTLAFIVAAPATAEDLTAKGAACAIIADSLERLHCFDVVFPKGASPEAANPAADPMAPETAQANWTITESKSPIDDSRQIVASLSPKNVQYTGVGEGQALLIMRCQDHTTSLLIATNMFMVDDTASVTMRVGDQKATTTRWDRSSNYKAVGLWNGNRAIPAIKSLMDSANLAIRIQARDRLDAQFDLGNVSAAITRIATTCGWPK